MNNTIIYRALQTGEEAFLREMFYTALFVRPGQPPFPPEIIDKPELRKYFEHWGSGSSDIAIVAVDGLELIGAVWGRAFSQTNKSYGFIDGRTPEISMAVKETYRNRGIGMALLSHIEASYRQGNAPAISLSVDQLSPALRLYQRFGFTLYEEAGTAFTMRKAL